MELNLGIAIQRVVIAVESHSPPEALPEWKEYCGQGRCRYVIKYKIHPHFKMVSESHCELSMIFPKTAWKTHICPKDELEKDLKKINHLEISQASDRFILHIHAPMVSPTPTSKYLLLLPLLHRAAGETLRLW